MHQLSKRKKKDKIKRKGNVNLIRTYGAIILLCMLIEV